MLVFGLAGSQKSALWLALGDIRQAFPRRGRAKVKSKPRAARDFADVAAALIGADQANRGGLRM
jgi:hypothetical protein